MQETSQTPKAILKAEEAAEEFMERFSYKSSVEKILKEKDNNMPLVTTANVAIFATMSAILISMRGDDLSAVELIVLVSAIFSLVLIPLNIWFVSRLQLRETKFDEEQQKTYDETKKKITQTIDLLYTVALNSRENLTTDVLVTKSSFIFHAMNELGIRKTIDNRKKFMNSELDENFPTLKLFFDRLSTKSRYFGLGVNIVLMFCALLISTLVK